MGTCFAFFVLALAWGQLSSEPVGKTEPRRDCDQRGAEGRGEAGGWEHLSTLPTLGAPTAGGSTAAQPRYPVTQPLAGRWHE